MEATVNKSENSSLNMQSISEPTAYNHESSKHVKEGKQDPSIKPEFPEDL
jgi:hypothetical protein